MANICLFDSTLRDGSHAIKHQLTAENVREYCKAIDSAGLYTVIVGHGNGLGASSLQVGLSLTTDLELLTIARDNLIKTKLGIYMIPGFGTIKDDLMPAIELGVEVFCIGCHCSEADVTRQHIEFLRSSNKETYGVLMMYHTAPLEKLVEEAQKMQAYGANGVIIMDSAGASTPKMVQATITALVSRLNIPIGFHPHNNLGLAVSNAYIAFECGAKIIDGTIRGFGAGAGNCQLEAFAALMKKSDIDTEVDLYTLLDVSEDIVAKLMPRDTGLSAISIVSGMSGVFSSFATQVLAVSKQLQLDPRDLFVELGNRKVVGGQEDYIIEIGNEMLRQKIQAQSLSF